MASWLILFLLAALVLLALWRIGRVRGPALQFSAAALFLGIAGYAWQGTPGEPGDPSPPKTDAMQPDSDFAKERSQFMGRFGSSAQWLDFADALHRANRDRAAVTAMQTALAQNPKDPDLWVGLGNALVIQGGGLVSPAARLAFERAARISPDHPGPRFFMGLAYAQSGQPDKAQALWQELLAKSPPDAPWRKDLEQRLAELQGQMGGSAATTPGLPQP
ncbi:MAG: tetratricopeptide repeat protein [Sphingomonadaceae bacterium]|nr:tetratricopeptide repeat protein [Sphingomonadaceae bacterium]